jgi:manganese/zinc/iron transport system substrate-binding protein
MEQQWQARASRAWSRWALRWIALSAVISLGLLAIGCSTNQPPGAGSSASIVCSEREWFSSEKLHVLCTTAQVADLVAQVAGPDASVLVLISGDLDPHSYQLVKGDDEKLETADLVFASGLGLEHGPSLQQFLSTNRKVVRLGDLIARQDGVNLIQVEGQTDPHIWLDASLWMRAVDPIASSLAEAIPAQKDAILMRAAELRDSLSRLDGEIQQRLAAIAPDRRFLVTSHDAFQYFTRRYLATAQERDQGGWQSRLCAPEGLAPEGQLGLSDIQRVLKFCEDHRVQVLFPESNVNTSPLKKVVDSGRHRGLPLRLAREPLYGDTMGEESGCGMPKAYEAMMRANSQNMASEWERE